MITFKHAGDLGDIVFSLPVMRALCNGEPSIFYIEAASYTRQYLTQDKWCGLDLLLRRQPYITDVLPYPLGQPVHRNLNDFRAKLFMSLRGGIGKDKHLTHWMCDAHGVPHSVLLEQWLTITDPVEAAPVVFSRAGAGRPPHQVYQNDLFPWYRICEKYRGRAVFVGTEHEHKVFCAAFGDVPHYKTAGLLEAARVIAGCRLFVGNQTATHAIAEGLKKNIILEVWKEGPNCIVHRPGVIHGWNGEINLPEV